MNKETIEELETVAAKLKQIVEDVEFIKDGLEDELFELPEETDEDSYEWKVLSKKIETLEDAIEGIEDVMEMLNEDQE